MSKIEDVERIVRGRYSEAKLERIPTIGSHIVVMGMPGSGKTTTLRAFVGENTNWKYNYSRLMAEDARFSWLLSQIFFNKNDRRYINFQIEATVCRFFQNMMPRENDICDNDIFSIWAYSRMLFSLDLIESDDFETIYSVIYVLNQNRPIPKRAVLFSCSPDISRERVISRGRKHEVEAYDLKCLNSLEKQNKEVFEKWPAETECFSIDTSSLSREDALGRFAAIINANRD